jgi:hypothetical protein
MSRARIAALATLGAATLTAVGVAAAGHRAQTTQQAAASFGAGAVSHARTTTCVASDGTYQDTNATYTGNATSSDSRLGGALVIRAHSVVNTTSGLGWLEGTFRVRSGDSGAHGTIHAALASNKAVGAVTGTVNRPAGKLVASFAAGFTASAGFTDGVLGAGSGASGAGTVFTRGACTKTKRLALTAVSKLRLTANQVVQSQSASRSVATGSLTLDVNRDSNGTITGAKAVFYVNYRFPGAVTIDHLALYQGARGTNGTQVLDSGAPSLGDADGRGNLTESIASVDTSLAQALLTSPRDYYVQLDTSAGGLRDQLGGFARR